ncbi:hypothetical protein BKA63DRAFT_274932 [Paraphoma chrysanthemicola]|nr:hypothetical protein BKA63DRAFT_274932 [Paraphoma chrysanthemicola]
MDGLSGVASGMAVASLSIQLLESIGTIRAFIRDVKAATKELQRLAELLDRLRDLLEDVRNVMKQQTSLQTQHFPAPSVTIFNSLKSCEEALRVLEQAVEKYKSPRNGAGSAMTRLKADVRFGFKTKDIAAFEARIQREIDHLHAALGMNMTSILITTLPALFENQQTFMTLCLQSSEQPYLASALEQGASCSDSDLVSWSKSPGLKPITRQYRLASSLERVGIYQRVTVRYLQHKTRGGDKMSDSVEDVISETRDVLLKWKILNFGLQWTRKYPYGGIGTSLTVYPVIEGFTAEHYDLLKTASILEIQQTISSGQLHPLLRDGHGRSLLH